MDPFVAVLFGGIFAFVLLVWLLGRLYPGSGLEQLGLKSAREIIETREALETEDLDQMVAARNLRRRERGQAEISREELELQVAHDTAEQERRRRRYVAEERAHAQETESDRAAAASDRAEAERERAAAESDLDSLLAVTNARRRARGLPERTREQARSELGGRAESREPDGPPGPPTSS